MARQTGKGGYIDRMTSTAGGATMIDTAFFSEIRMGTVELCRTPGGRGVAGGAIRPEDSRVEGGILMAGNTRGT